MYIYVYTVTFAPPNVFLPFTITFRNKKPPSAPVSDPHSHITANIWWAVLPDVYASHVYLQYRAFHESLFFIEVTGLNLTVKPQTLLYLPPDYPPHSSSFIHQRQFSPVAGSVAKLTHKITFTSHNFPYPDYKVRPFTRTALKFRSV
jgi:hypothetical protein